MDWIVKLKVDTADLIHLKTLLQGSKYKLIERDDYCFSLTHEDWSSLANSQDVLATAEECLRIANGLLHMESSKSQPMEATGLVALEGNGQSHQFVHTQPIAIAIEVYPPTVKVGGKEGGPDTPSAEWIDAALDDEALARTLRIMGEPSSWGGLYKVFEFVRARTGGESNLKARQWANWDEIKRFTRTANHQEAAGDGARHSMETKDPPKRPMTLTEARSLVTSLLKRWMEENHPVMKFKVSP